MERRYEAGGLDALRLTGTEGGQSEIQFGHDEDWNQDIFNCKEYSRGVGADDAIYFELVGGLEEDDPARGDESDRHHAHAVTHEREPVGQQVANDREADPDRAQGAKELIDVVRTYLK